MGKNCVGKNKGKSNGTRLIAYLGYEMSTRLVRFIFNTRKKGKDRGGERDRCRLSFDDFR